MDRTYFVDERSIVRTIWGKADTVLFIFAGAAAEFALNRAVDWLYFTGRIPSDPLGRLFSTVAYAQSIIFSNEKQALRAINSMNSIHSQVEENRGTKIPDWAYRDVLFLLIDYSIRSYEILERKLTTKEKEDVFNVFSRVGLHMGLKGLPASYPAWERAREEHLRSNLCHSQYTTDLFNQYRKHLGDIRYRILIEVQVLIVPQYVRELLGFGNGSKIYPLLTLYHFSKRLHVAHRLLILILPSEFKEQVKTLDRKSI